MLVKKKITQIPYFHDNTARDMYDFTYRAPILHGIIYNRCLYAWYIRARAVVDYFYTKDRNTRF